jgi:hypothetical protein
VDTLRHRRLLKERRRRYRARLHMELMVVDVPVSLRFLSYLAETGQLSEAELAADNRSADGALARAIARLADAAVTAWEESTEGRISTEENGLP